MSIGKAMTKAYQVQIYIAGDYQKAVDVCRQFCIENPWCVAVTKTDFVFTGGMESGVCVTAINYARFPAHFVEIKKKAIALGHQLRRELSQRTFTVIDGHESIWFHDEGVAR